jgi:hypothetical protein
MLALAAMPASLGALSLAELLPFGDLELPEAAGCVPQAPRLPFAGIALAPGGTPAKLARLALLTTPQCAYAVKVGPAGGARWRGAAARPRASYLGVTSPRAPGRARAAAAARRRRGATGRRRPGGGGAMPLVAAAPARAPRRARSV